jgi:hypothetical protein
MKSFAYACVIGISHTKEKVNVFNDKYLPKSINTSFELKNGFESWDE